MLLVIVLLISSAVSINCTPIVNGLIVFRVENPFVVHLAIKYEEKMPGSNTYSVIRLACGGSIITKKTILTAAHCLEDSIPRPTVDICAGVVQEKDFKVAGQWEKMSTYAIHPDYTSKNIDIALVFLENDFVLKPGRVEIGEFTKVKLGAVVRATGWGLMEFRLHSDILRKAFQMIMRRAKCGAEYDNDNFICVGDPKKKSTVCSGDSGGPIIYNDKIACVIIEANFEEVIGKDGKKVDQCYAKYPVPCVDVNTHMDWITTNKKE